MFYIFISTFEFLYLIYCNQLKLLKGINHLLADFIGKGPPGRCPWPRARGRGVAPPARRPWPPAYGLGVSPTGRMGKQWKQCQTLLFGAPKSLQMVTTAMKLKDAYSLEGKL